MTAWGVVGIAILAVVLAASMCWLAVQAAWSWHLRHPRGGSIRDRFGRHGLVPEPVNCPFE